MNTINLDDEVCCELTAFYSSSSKWELDFDLNDTYNWYVKWDTLYVQHKESDSDFEEYEPIFSAFDGQSLKHPESLYLDDEEVKN